MIAISPSEYLFNDHALVCHASTLLPTRDGGFLVACFNGSCEGKDDTCIRLACLRDGCWEYHCFREAFEPHWNPVLFRLPDGRIALYFKAGKTIEAWRTLVVYSLDEGRTWTSAVELVPGPNSGGRGPAKNKPLLLSSGVIAAPTSIEPDYWYAFVDLSADGGKTWEKSAMVPLPPVELASNTGRKCDQRLGCIQPTLWESPSGIVHMLLRSNVGAIYRSDSADGGRTWREAYPIALSNNNSGLDLCRLDDGTLLLACNPVSGNWTARYPLSLFQSADDGETWSHVLDLETGPEGDLDYQEYSYPAIIPLPGNRFAITYTHNRHRIAFRLGEKAD